MTILHNPIKKFLKKIMYFLNLLLTQVSNNNDTYRYNGDKTPLKDKISLFQTNHIIKNKTHWLKISD